MRRYCKPFKMQWCFGLRMYVICMLISVSSSSVQKFTRSYFIGQLRALNKRQFTCSLTVIPHINYKLSPANGSQQKMIRSYLLYVYDASHDPLTKKKKKYNTISILCETTTCFKNENTYYFFLAIVSVVESTCVTTRIVSDATCTLRQKKKKQMKSHRHICWTNVMCMSRTFQVVR